MDLRGSGHMRWMKLSAVLLAVLIVALGAVALPQGVVAGGNEDVVQVPRGDPDTGGGRAYSPKAGSWSGVSARSVLLLHVSLSKWAGPLRAASTMISRRSATARR